MLDIDISQNNSWEPETDWDALAFEATRAAILTSPFAPMIDAAYRAEISIKMTDDEEVQELNARFRSKDKPTNVLSFPMVQADLLSTLTNSDDGEVLLGDIVLAHGVCAREAKEKGIPIEQHASHLVVHGTLHLLGYDHELGDAEAEEMEQLETRALATLGIDDPYADVTGE